MQMNQDALRSRLSIELEAVTREALTAAAGLSDEQLQWSDGSGWSIAQIFEHLVLSERRDRHRRVDAAPQPAQPSLRLPARQQLRGVAAPQPQGAAHIRDRHQVASLLQDLAQARTAFDDNAERIRRGYIITTPYLIFNELMQQ